MIVKIIILVFSIITPFLASPVKYEDGYKVGCIKCHQIDKKKINIHLIPHSHDDVGWVKTVDEYYYGLKSADTSTSVYLIISSVVDALKKNPNRRYIQVETAFFYKWWEENENMRADFKQLVENGQIEMVNGAWSMNDEACVNYQSTIDQFTLGLRKIEETVGKCGRPRVGWQIDPFGHSREQASLLAQMGYDGVMFARIDHDDKNKRKLNGDLDFLWEGSANLGNSSVMFGSIFPTDLYNEPDWFCWDVLCGDDQIVDNPKSPIYNVKEKVKQFTKDVLEVFKTYYPKNVRNIMIPMGGDFQYQAAEYNFINMDRLIKAFANDSKYNILYSTPSCYIKAVNDANPKLKLKTDDFFPYSERNNSFWAGYFTSRPTVKRFERIGHNILQATKQMYALNSKRSFDKNLESLQEAMGVMQHHDAITGTEQQHVADDYVRMLTAAIHEAEKPMREIISNIFHSTANLNFTTCLLTNVSICRGSQNNDQFVVVVYNPLAWTTTHYIRLPVTLAEFQINGPDGIEQSDLIETLSKFEYLDIDDEWSAFYELVFAARNIPPMGFKVYHIQNVDYKQNIFQKHVADKFESKAFQIDNKTNLLKSVTLNGVVLNISQNFYFYQSNDGFQNDGGVTGGAYIFRPIKNNAEPATNLTILRSYNGKLVDEIHQKWNYEHFDVYQSIRWYKTENYLEFDWIVGNINLDNLAVGKEIISRFTIDNFDNKDIFYTDSNGREMIKRIKNKRFDYTYNSSQEPVASNYYPVTSKIVLKDEEKNLEVAVLNDRSQGGTSLNKGQFELMLHRRLIFDDEKGVQESLSEEEYDTGLYARGSHYLIFGQAKNTNKSDISTAAKERILAQKKLLQPWVGVSETTMTLEQLKSHMKLSYPSALTKELPQNINILTFEQWSNDSYLLRLEHILEKGEDSILSRDATIPNIKGLFKNIKVTEATEMALSAQITLSELKQRRNYHWTTRDGSLSTVNSKAAESDEKISLAPMEIRTFILKTGHIPNPSTGATPAPTSVSTSDPSGSGYTNAVCIQMLIFCLSFVYFI